MSEPIIEIKNIGKRYNINHGQGSYVALRDVIMNVLKKPFAFFKSKVMSAIGLSGKEDFWALRDVNFNVERGEVIGIIGPNGAGKSTLLKILSQITPPTEGEIRIRGRVGSLLEVGTGFHPELTGRENIFLNGAILGMTRKEVSRKFDEIMAFSGVEKFIDTPVKFYSSGMYVRLAFSVAAHMEPDILIVDEVLAVGDAEFQKKCLGKMDEISKGEGRTVIFVSHNLSAIENLCDKCVVIQNGRVDFFGQTTEAISHYMDSTIKNLARLDERRRAYGPGNFSKFIGIETRDSSGRPANTIKMFEPFEIVMDIELKSSVKNFEIGFSVHSLLNVSLSTFIGQWEGLPTELANGKHRITCTIKEPEFFPGDYGVTVWIKRKDDSVDQQIDHAIQFTMLGTNINGRMPDFRYQNMGIYQKSDWKTSQI
jgi:lipopolysaccharide transport system ATP-binding protein